MDAVAAEVLYYLADGLGSIAALVDAAADIIAGYRYDAFGTVTEETGTSENSYKFTGRVHDESTGLYYLRNRYYDPYGGRFLSRDPWGTTIGEVNPYVYADNNPVNLVDLFGLRSFVRHFNGKRYSSDEYDESCLDAAYRKYNEAYERVCDAISKMERDLNNMLNRMRNEARERADSSFMHAAIGLSLIHI